MDPEIRIKSAPLDFELCELLGEGSADFLLLCFDGEPFKVYGTPYDTSSNRIKQQWLIDGLNDRSKESWWPEFFAGWKAPLQKQYGLPDKVGARSKRPKASWIISRVCHGYSSHLHCAVGLFKMLGTRLESWATGKDGDGISWVELVSDSGLPYVEKGDDLPRVIALAVKRLLVAEGLPNDQGQTTPHNHTLEE